MAILTLPALADSQVKVPVMPDEATVLRDAALFFQNPQGFEDRAAFGSYLEAKFRIGTTEEEIKTKISGLITALHPTPRMHCSIEISPNKLIISFRRFFGSKATGGCLGTDLNITYLFDVDHRLSHYPIEMIDEDPNDMVPEKDIEPPSPNQPPLRMPVSGTPAANAPVAPPPGIAGR